MSLAKNALCQGLCLDGFAEKAAGISGCLFPLNAGDAARLVYFLVYLGKR